MEPSLRADEEENDRRGSELRELAAVMDGAATSGGGDVMADERTGWCTYFLEMTSMTEDDAEMEDVGAAMEVAMRLARRWERIIVCFVLVRRRVVVVW